MAQKMDREILFPRRRGDADSIIKRIDMQLRRKEECRDRHLGGGYFRDFVDEITPRATPTTETNPDIMTTKAAANTESTVSSSPEGHNTITGAYPAIPVQKYRDGLIEEIAVHCVRINCIKEKKAVGNGQQEGNVRSAELDFMLDLETLLN